MSDPGRDRGPEGLEVGLAADSLVAAIVTVAEVGVDGGRAEPGEVLRGGDHAAVLQPLDEGRARARRPRAGSSPKVRRGDRVLGVLREATSSTGARSTLTPSAAQVGTAPSPRPRSAPPPSPLSPSSAGESSGGPFGSRFTSPPSWSIITSSGGLSPSVAACWSAVDVGLERWRRRRGTITPPTCPLRDPPQQRLVDPALAPSLATIVWPTSFFSGSGSLARRLRRPRSRRCRGRSGRHDGPAAILAAPHPGREVAAMARPAPGTGTSAGVKGRRAGAPSRRRPGRRGDSPVPRRAGVASLRGLIGAGRSARAGAPLGPPASPEGEVEVDAASAAAAPGGRALRARPRPPARPLRPPRARRSAPATGAGWTRSRSQIVVRRRAAPFHRPRPPPSPAASAAEIPSSRSWRSSTGAGAPVSGSRARGGLRERDHVANRLRAVQQGDDPVEAVGDAAVRRRAVARAPRAGSRSARSACSSSMPIASNTLRCTSGSLMRIEPPPISHPFQTTS